jgi:Flp pilus assembly protein TadG
MRVAERHVLPAVKAPGLARTDFARGGPEVLRGICAHLTRCRRQLTRLRHATQGATAVEFALIAPIFLATLIAIVEVAIFLFAQQYLQTAASEVGRQFMTGQAQAAGMKEQDYITKVICPKIQTLFSCSSLMVNVQTYSSFVGANSAEPVLTYNAQGQVTNTWAYNPGNPGDVMVVQLIYQWPIVSGPFGYVLKNLGNGKTELMGVSAFRVEPY